MELNCCLVPEIVGAFLAIDLGVCEAFDNPTDMPLEIIFVGEDNVRVSNCGKASDLLEFSEVVVLPRVS